MHLESFAHELNIPVSHKNVPEYLECTQNSVRIFRMHFDCQRMHYEISFRLHSGSFRHSCDCPFTYSLFLLAFGCVWHTLLFIFFFIHESWQSNAPWTVVGALGHNHFLLDCLFYWNSECTLTASAAQDVCDFYTHDTMLAQVFAIATCPSVTSRYFVKTKTASVMISLPSGSPMILVFWRQISSPNSKGPPNMGLKEGWGVKIQRFSSYKRQYLENGRRYGQSYY